MAKDSRSILSWFISIIVILLIVLLINAIIYFFSNPLISDLTAFINDNIILIILISLFFFLGSLFYSFGTGFDILNPIFESIGVTLTAWFLIKLIALIDTYITTGIGNILVSYAPLILTIVFILSLILGFVSLYREPSTVRVRHRDDEEEVEEEIIDEEPRPIDRVSRSHRRRVVRRRRRI